MDKNIPYCFIDGERDTTSTKMSPLAEQMQAAGFHATCVRLDDGHMFPMHRATIARITIEHFSK